MPQGPNILEYRKQQKNFAMKTSMQMIQRSLFSDNYFENKYIIIIIIITIIITIITITIIPLGRSRRRCEDNITMELEEIGINAGNWVASTQDRDYWRALVNAALNL